MEIWQNDKNLNWSDLFGCKSTFGGGGHRKTDANHFRAPDIWAEALTAANETDHDRFASERSSSIFSPLRSCPLLSSPLPSPIVSFPFLPHPPLPSPFFSSPLLFQEKQHLHDVHLKSSSLVLMIFGGKKTGGLKTLWQGPGQLAPFQLLHWLQTSWFMARDKHIFNL